jgi:hypothetical protein
MSKELKNSKGQVREIVSQPSGERGLEEQVAMTCSDGDYKEGPNDEAYKFGAVDFSKGEAKIGTMSVAVSDRGIVRFEGMSQDHGPLDLTLDLTKLDSEGKGKVLGHINGKTVDGKIDPNAPEQEERGWFKSLVSTVGSAAGGIAGSFIGGPAGTAIGKMVGGAAGNIAGGIGESFFRDMPTEVKFEANRGFLDFVAPFKNDVNKVLGTALTVGQKWWNANVNPDSLLGQAGNTAFGVLSQKLK